MEEGYMNPFVEMGASLAELVIKGTASAVNKKIWLMEYRLSRLACFAAIV